MMIKCANHGDGFKVIIYCVLLLLTAPKAYFELGLHSDSAIRLVQNHLFNDLIHGELMHTYLPQGILSFLQYPLNLDLNYTLFFIYHLFIASILLIKLDKLGYLWASLCYLVLYFLMGQRFLVFPLFLLLLLDRNKASLIIAFVLLIIQLIVRVPMAVIMAIAWLLLGHQFYPSWRSKSLFLVLSLIFVFGGYMAYPLIAGSTISDLSLVFSNNAMLGIGTRSWMPFVPILISFFALSLVYYFKKWAAKGRLSSKMLVLVFIFIVSVYYLYQRLDLGTYYVAYNLILAGSLVFLIDSRVKPYISIAFAGFVYLIFSLVAYQEFNRPIKFTKLDPGHAWATFFDLKESKGDEFNFSANREAKGLIIFPWNQMLEINAQKRITPYYVSYTAVDSTLDMRNLLGLGDSVLVHKANYNAAKYDANDINGLYLGFSNSFFVAGLAKYFEPCKDTKEYTLYCRSEEFRSTDSILTICDYSIETGITGFDVDPKCDLVRFPDERISNSRVYELVLSLSNGEEVSKKLKGGLLRKGIYGHRFLLGSNYKIDVLKVNSLRLVEAP